MADAWGGSWGSSWASSWGDGAVAPTRGRGWDDAHSKYRRPRRQVIILPDEPEEEASDDPVKVRVTRKAVKKALEHTGPLVWPLSVTEAVKVLPSYVRVAPELGKPDTSAITAAIVQRLKAEIIRREMEADEDDIEMLLMSAA